MGGEPLVLKVTEDDCYLQFLKFVETNKDLKHLPTVHDNISLNGCNYILLTKLYCTDKCNNELAQIQGWWESDPDVWRGECLSLDCTLDKLEDYYDLYSELHNLHWDLRDSNIMETSEGELVIIDPWSESKCY